MESIADHAVSLASKAFKYSEAYAERNISYSFAVEQGKANGGSFSDKSGIRLRLIKGGSLYTYSTNMLSVENIDNAISSFREFKGKPTSLSSERSVKASYKVREKEKLDSEILFKNIIEIDKLLEKDKRVKYRAIYGSISTDKTYLKTSEGTEITSSIPALSYMVSIIVGNGKETRQRFLQFGSVGGMEQQPMDKLLNAVESEVKNISGVIERGKSLSTYELSKVRNIVISPEIAGIAVHESVGHPSEADRIFRREAAQAGTSYISRANFGLRIGGNAVTIIDDPTIKNAYGFFSFDDEGIKARPKLLVKNGIQNELLLNREYAAYLNTKSNASARSDSYSNEPIIRMSNTYLKPGNSKFDELVREAKNGIYVKSFMEWNIDDTRSFARYQGNEAYEIRNGSIEEPIKNYKIEATTLGFWNAVKLVSNEFSLYTGSCGKGEPLQGVNVTMGGPSALLSFGD